MKMPNMDYYVEGGKAFYAGIEYNANPYKPSGDGQSLDDLQAYDEWACGWMDAKHYELDHGRVY